MNIIGYSDNYEKDYIKVHNEGFAGKDSVYTGKIEKYNQTNNILKTFIAIKNNEVIGFIDIVELEDKKNEVEIDPIGVLPKYRNKGTGSLLIDRAIEWSRKEGFKKIRALVSSSADKRLHRFYRRNNFVMTGQIFADKDGNIEETGPKGPVPFSPEKIKGHVHVYEFKNL